MGRIRREPLHEQVARTLRRKIQDDHKAGDRLLSERHLSRWLGVSVLTLREALSVLAGEGLIERRHGSGTYVASGCGSGVVGLVLEEFFAHPRAGGFHRRVAERFTSHLEVEGFRVRLYPRAGPSPGAGGEADFLRDLRDGRLQGVAVVGRSNGRSWRAAACSREVPVVAIGGGAPLEVIGDRDGLFREGVDELVDRGCRRIALLSADEALGGFWRRVAHHGLDVPDAWVRAGVPVEEPGAAWQALEALWSARDEKPEGLLVADPDLFPDAALAIVGMGLSVPGDLEVVTASDSESQVTLPFPATLLEADCEAWAQTAAALVQRGIAGQTTGPLRVLMPVERRAAEPAVAS